MVTLIDIKLSGSEDRSLYLRNFLNDICCDVTKLYHFFQSKSFSNIPFEKVARNRVKFLVTLSDLTDLDEEYSTLTGRSHLGYNSTTMKLNRLVKQSGNQLDYLRVQSINLN